MFYHEDNYYQGPAEPTERPILRCDACDCDIYEGETYYNINGEKWCESCVKDNSHIA